MKKLSKTQKAVIDLMADGWELGVSTSFDGRCWLQNGGCGKGGDSSTVSSSTVNALRKAGAIKMVSFNYPTEKYHLAV